MRQGTDAAGEVVSTWRFDPDGTVLEGPEGPVSHLICGGVYDWSTGLIYQGGRYFDPALGIWLALLPLAVVQGGRKRKSRRQGVLLLCVALLAVGTLAGCGPQNGTGTSTATPTPTLTCTPNAPLWPSPTPTVTPWPTSTSEQPTLTPEPAPGKGVYLTFDDGPGWNPEQVGNTNSILDILKQKGVRATFFVLGGGLSNGRVLETDWNASVRRMNNEGHSLGVHGWMHADLTRLGANEVRQELQKTLTAIQGAIGRWDITLWRAPYGAVNDEVTGVAQELGFYHPIHETPGRQIFWNVDSLDHEYANDTRSGGAQALRKQIVDDVNWQWEIGISQPIVLMHSIHTVTVDALPGIIDDLRAAGSAFLTF